MAECSEAPGDGSVGHSYGIGADVASREDRTSLLSHFSTIRFRAPAIVAVAAAVLVVTAWLAVTGHHATAQQAAAQQVSYSGAIPRPQTADDGQATPATPPWKDFTVQRGDTLASLFQQAGLTAAQLLAVVHLKGPVRQLVALRPGDQLRIRSDAQGNLTELRYPLDALNTLVIDRVGDGLHATVAHVDPSRRLVIASGVLYTSLSSAMQRQGLDSSMVADVANIFRWRVNFRRDLRPGTSFSVMYQKLYRGDRLIGTGPIVAVQLHIGDRSLQAFRFDGGHGDVHYYDQHGHSLTPSLLRTPVHYIRVSSPFSLHRFDPVVHVWRPHYGVDLAAPAGTPIHAAGDGVIKYIGPAAGYGNLVEIRNFGPYTTRYAHMRRFAKGLHDGSRVHQGEVIGYVGETGEATGPHLHFEIRVNGVPHNPLKMRLPDGSPIPRRDRARFEAQIHPLLAALDHQQTGAVRLADSSDHNGAALMPALN